MQRAVIKDYCHSCKYFYGKVHALGPLVCAVHPYGPDVESCPDWELNLPTSAPPNSGDRYRWANHRLSLLRRSQRRRCYGRKT